MSRFDRPLGHALLVGAVAGAAFVGARDDVRAATRRIGGEVSSALRPADERDARHVVTTVEGVRVGSPVHVVRDDGVADVVGHVVAIERGAETAVRVRAAAGAAIDPSWQLTVHPPRRSLRDAVSLTIPDDEARRFGDAVATRALALWEAEVRPAVESRLPSFLARIDPSADTETRTVVTEMSDALVRRLDPFVDELSKHVTRDIERKFDLLDRLGLLWKFVRGDGQGLRREIVPVAKRSAEAWWSVNRDRVMRAIGAALEEKGPRLRAWVEDELIPATLDEIVEPVWDAQRPRLEAEAEALLRVAGESFVESPAGGFRVRFATAVRHVLLGKKTALLLFVPPEGE